tara:strand:- start:976 stop:1605 length:630 start_codon:yes stop_codon:yes gene_type:complete
MIIKIKKATKKNIQFILKVRNQNISRKFSTDKKKIPYLEHYKWFKQNHLKKDFFLYIILVKKKQVGYVRVQKIEFKNFVSIAILKNWQNFGIAKLALRYVEIEVQKNIRSIYANVNRYNKNSISLFRGLNYKIYKIEKDKIFMKKELNKFNYLKLIQKIEKIRKKNNSNWMDILKIAFKYAPDETAKTMAQIYKEDSNISKLTKKLSKK